MRPLATDLSIERRRRLTRRLLPALGGVALIALVVGVIVGSSHESSEERVARSFASAWERRDYPRMHSLLTPAARARFTLEEFARAYRYTTAIATAASLDARDPDGERDGGVVIPTTVRT